MTRNQADWAAQHDWHRATYAVQPGVYVVLVRADGEHDADGYNVNDGYFKRFADVVLLRQWAGY